MKHAARLMIALLLLACLPNAAAAQNDREMTAEQREQAMVEEAQRAAEIIHLQQQLRATELQTDQLLAAIDAMKADLNAIENRNGNDAEQIRQALKERIDVLSAALNDTLDQKADVAERLAALTAQDQPERQDNPAQADTPDVEATDAEAEGGLELSPSPEQFPDFATERQPGVFHVYRMDGSLVIGRLINESLTVRTEYGELVVPIGDIQSLAPGLSSHPMINQELQQLFRDLSSPLAEQRDLAQQALIDFGPGLLNELELRSGSNDPEVRVRIQDIIRAIHANWRDDHAAPPRPAVSLNQLDRVVTQGFTIVGHIQEDTLTLQTDDGQVVLERGDIMLAEHPAIMPVMLRSLTITGEHMACNNFRSTGINVQAGDAITVIAHGQITMSPWGGGTVSTPQGIPRLGTYAPRIPLGALVGRIGEEGEPFLVGERFEMTAQQSGELYLGFAMSADWANQPFPGSYETRIHITPGN